MMRNSFLGDFWVPCLRHSGVPTHGTRHCRAGFHMTPLRAWDLPALRAL